MIKVLNNMIYINVLSELHQRIKDLLILSMPFDFRYSEINEMLIFTPYL
jgi:hypothetical protein